METEDQPVDMVGIGSMPSPTDAMLESPLFEAIWQTIKTWDVNVPEAYRGYCGANGIHARLIFEAVAPFVKLA
jgi:hypothetical protein